MATYTRKPGTPIPATKYGGDPTALFAWVIATSGWDTAAGFIANGSDNSITVPTIAGPINVLQDTDYIKWVTDHFEVQDSAGFEAIYNIVQ